MAEPSSEEEAATAEPSPEDVEEAAASPGSPRKTTEESMSPDEEGKEVQVINADIWEAKWIEHYSCFQYWNTFTGESTWNRNDTV